MYFHIFEGEMDSRSIVDDFMSLPSPLAVSLVFIDEYIRKLVPNIKERFCPRSGRWVYGNNRFAVRTHPHAEHAVITLYGKPERFITKSDRLPLSPDRRSYSRCVFSDPLQTLGLLTYIERSNNLKGRAEVGSLWPTVRP